MQNFRALGVPPPDPKQPPSLQISAYASEYFFVHFELNHLSSLLMFLCCFQSLWYATQSIIANCLLTKKLKVKMQVKKAHVVDSSFTYIHTIASAIVSQQDKYELLKRDYAWNYMKSFRGAE